MSTTGRPADRTPPASDVAARLREADLVRIAGHASGDGLAATGLLGRALAATAVPFQAGIAPLGDRDSVGTDADLTVGVGRPDVDADIVLGGDEPASASTFAVASELDAADAVLAGAGVRSASAVPQGTLAAALERAGHDRRPGLAVPTPDPADGLAHSTLVHGPFSGDTDAAESTLEPVADAAEDGQRLASLTALATVGGPASERAAEAVSSVLHPYDGGPLETLGGYGDVLAAAAHADPGRGLAVALGHADPASLLDVWRDHGARVHAGVRTAETSRHDGLVVVRGVEDAALASVARLVRDFRSPEPVVLVLGDGTAVARAADGLHGLTDAARTAVGAVGGGAAGTATHARASVDDTEAFADAFREALA